MDTLDFGVDVGEFWQIEGQDGLYEEYSLWLEAHGLHDEEEPPEDTLVGYGEDGEEIHLRQTGGQVALDVGVDVGEFWEVFGL